MVQLCNNGVINTIQRRWIIMMLSIADAINMVQLCNPIVENSPRKVVMIDEPLRFGCFMLFWTENWGGSLSIPWPLEEMQVMSTTSERAGWDACIPWKRHRAVLYLSVPLASHRAVYLSTSLSVCLWVCLSIQLIVCLHSNYCVYFLTIYLSIN